MMVARWVYLAVLVAFCVASAQGKLKYAGMTYTNERYCPNVSMLSPVGMESLQHLATTGTNFVAVVVTQYQDDINSSRIYSVPAPIACTATPHGACVTASDNEIALTAQYIRSLGMRVFLKPHIDLIKASSPSYWRGDIGKNMTEPVWAIWFASYEAMIIRYAMLAQRLKVDLFSVTCELVTATTQHEAWWRRLIAKVRQFYWGPLTASANWASLDGKGELTEIHWWDAVDVIGVDEYYMAWNHPTMLPNNTYPTVDTLVGWWSGVEQQLDWLHRFYNRSIIFTEIGFCSGFNGSCYKDGEVPHDPLTTVESLEFQAAQYEATLRAMTKYSWFEGVFWWNWATDAAFGGVDNSCMDPKYKPAESVLRKWYGASKPIPPPPNYLPKCKCWL